MWQAQLEVLGASSPLRPIAAGQLARLDREFGLPMKAGVRPHHP
jgi:hypothetical protein